MDELVKLVADKVGLSPNVAQQAVEVVMSFMKEKVPGQIADQLTGLLDGNASTGGVMSGLTDKLGDIMGGQSG